MSNNLNSFKTNLQALGFRLGTVNTAICCVSEFLNYIKTDYKSIESIHVLRYREYLQVRPKRRGTGRLSESMVNHHIYSLKLFFNYLIEIEEISVHPMNTLSFPSPKSRERIVLTTKEIDSLYEACETDREKALLGIYYGCGLRRSEGVNLTLKDIHFKDGLLYVRNGKNGKRRVVPMSTRVASDIKNYIINERFNPLNQSNLLLNQNCKNISGNSVSILFHQLLEKAEIYKEISLHSLRHSIATHLLHNGMGMEQVRDFLGHRNLESTQIYTRVLKSV
jgi:integrase/recombinase XerD